MTNNLYELPENCDFFNVGNNSSQEFDCSPQLKDRHFSKFQGLLINGPNQITWPKNIDPHEALLTPKGNSDSPTRLMISGLLKVPYNTLGLAGDLNHHVVLVAINQKSAETYSGRMLRFGFTRRPDMPSYIETQANLDSKQYFNIDLVQNLKLPIADATYTVYATLGEYTSNILTINTSVE